MSTEPRKRPSLSGLIEAEALPLNVSDEVSDIAWEASQAAFKLIADRLELLGYPVSGDFAPDETQIIDNFFTGAVLAMALNNPAISRMQDAEKGEN